MSKCIICFLFDVCFLGPILFAQSMITGRIVDNKSLPISYVDVVLTHGKDTMCTAGTISNEKGAYCFLDVPLGIYVITFERIGFIKFSQKVEVLRDTVRLGDVVLNANDIELEGVNVRGRKSLLKMNNGILELNVIDSYLKNEHDLFEVLKKVPGVQVQKEKIQVLGLGEATIYLNKKKILQLSEIENVSVKKIKKITLSTSPSVKYDADKNCILTIETIANKDDFRIQGTASLEVGDKTSEDINVDIQYSFENLILWGNYNLARKNSLDKEYTCLIICSDTVWQHVYDDENSISSNEHSYNVTLDYHFIDQYDFSVSYNGESISNDAESCGLAISTINNQLVHDIELANNNKKASLLHHVTTSLSGKMCTRMDGEISYDFVRKKNNLTQSVEKESIESLISVLYNETINEIHACDLNLKYNISEKQNFIIGGNFNKIRRDGMFNKRAYSNSENRKSIYASYSYSCKQFSVNLGIRYEALKTKSYGYALEGIVREYNNWFPQFSTSLAFPLGNISLAYSRRIVRPGFDILNGNMIYMNENFYQVGNPQIKHSLSHNLQFSMMLRGWLYFNLIYANMKDYMGYVFCSSPEDNSIVYQSWENHRRFQQIAPVINIAPDFKWWKPSLMLYYMQPIFHFSGETYNNPVFNMVFDNQFILPNQFMINVNYSSNTTGNYLMYRVPEKQVLNIKINKTFCSGKIDVSVFANDVFHKAKDGIRGTIHNIQINQSVKSDSRRVGISLIYYWSRPVQNGKKNALDKEINRL